MTKLIASVCAAAFALSSSAYAVAPVANISVVLGKVLVSHGHGFEVLQNSANLNVGDQILVGADSHAMITYLAQNCSIDISKPKTMTIAKTATCHTGETVAAIDATFITPANGDIYSAPGFDMGGTPMFIAGAVGLVGIAGVGYMLTKKVNSNTCTGAISACP